MMDINLPDVKAEVEAAFAKYEAALMSNDVDALQSLFWNSNLTIRYGIGEKSLRLPGNRCISRRSFAARPRAHHFAHRHHHLRPRLCHRLDLVSSADSPGQGRPPDADLGPDADGWRVVAAHVSVIEAV